MRPDTTTEASPLFAARIAGALWLIVIVASVATIGTRPLDWRADPDTLVAAATSAAEAIRLTFAVHFFGKICYIGVTILLYELLKPVNKSVALFGAFCGLAGLLSGTSSFNDFTGLSLLEESQRVAGSLANQLQTTAKMVVTTHALGSGGEDVFFGCQIAAIGYLIVRSHFIPRTIGVLLLLGGAGFLITSFTSFLSPPLGARLAPLILPIAVVGEGAATLWLLVKGVDVDEWRATAARRAAMDRVAV
jgi:hypothetical protein